MANEMRLVDADALFNSLADHWGIPKDWDGRIHPICDEALSTIENFPTVDARPVVHGRWEDGYAVRNGKEVYKSIDCSVCNEIFKIESHDREYWKKRFKFCPFCGSQMDGGDGE